MILLFVVEVVISFLGAHIFDFWWLIMIRYGSGSELSRVCALWGEGVLN